MSSQNEDWLNTYSGIPFVSDEELRDMNLLENLDVEISGMTRYFYQNPFWSDPTDPLRDTACRAAARHSSYHSAMFHLENRTSEKHKEGAPFRSFVKLVFSVSETGKFVNDLKAINYARSAAHHHSQQSWVGPSLVQEISLKRYEKWLSLQLVNDRDLFFHIQNWHQQEELIRLSHDQLSLNQYQLQMLQRANQIAKAQLESTNSLVDLSAKQSREDLAKINRSLTEIKKELG